MSVFILLAPMSSHANQKDDITKVCGNADFAASNSGVKADDCKAAWATHKAGVEDEVTAAVWGAVFGVCTLGCADTYIEKTTHATFAAAEKTAETAQALAKSTAATAALAATACTGAVATATGVATATATLESADIYTAALGAAGFIAIAGVNAVYGAAVTASADAADAAVTSAGTSAEETAAAAAAVAATPKTTLSPNAAAAGTTTATATSAGTAAAMGTMTASPLAAAASTAQAALSAAVTASMIAAPAYAVAAPFCVTAASTAVAAAAAAAAAIGPTVAEDTAQVAWLAAKNTALLVRTACYVGAAAGLVTDIAGTEVLSNQLKHLAPDAKNSSTLDTAMGDASMASTLLMENNMTAVCLNAAEAGLFTATRYKKMQADKSAAGDNLALAKSYVDPNVKTYDTYDANGFAAGPKNYSVVQGKSVAYNSATNVAAPGKSADTNSDVCSAAASGDGAAKLSCAVASDSNLAGVTNPGFQNAFQKASGMPLSNFLSQDTSSAAGTMMSSLGASGDSVDMSKLAMVVKNIPGLDHNYTNQAYAGGGKGGAAKGGSGLEPNFDDIMKNFMPKKDGEAERAPAGSSEMGFAKLQALANATPEDRKISIFDRVGYRYSVVNKNWVAPTGPAATPK